MNAITFAVRKKNGDYIKATVGPANRPDEIRFGLLDIAIVVFLLLSLGSLTWLLLAD
jgi:hypothetical protein